MIRARHPATFPALTLLGGIAMLALLALLARVAHAAPSDAIHDPLTAAPLETIATVRASSAAGGWALGLAAVLVVLFRGLAAMPGPLGAWLRVGRRATAVAVGGAGAAALYDSLATGSGWGPALVAALAAGAFLWHPTITPVAPAPVSDPTLTAAVLERRPGAGIVTRWLLVMLAGAGLTALLALGGCAGARARAANATAAGVSCELGAVAAQVPELVPLAEAAILRAISGTGQVDTSALDRLLDSLTSAAPRCAVATVIAGMATPTADAGPHGLLAAPDPAPQLVLALGAARQRWGGAWTGPIVTSRGAL